MLHFRPIPFFGAVAALLLTGCYDSRFGEPDDDGEGKPATETIAALRDRYAGTPFTVTGDIVVTGEGRELRPRGEFLPHALHLRR